MKKHISEIEIVFFNTVHAFNNYKESHRCGRICWLWNEALQAKLRENTQLRNYKRNYATIIQTLRRAFCFKLRHCKAFVGHCKAFVGHKEILQCALKKRFFVEFFEFQILSRKLRLQQYLIMDSKLILKLSKDTVSIKQL